MTEETAASEVGGAEAVAPVETEPPSVPSSARESLSKHFADGWEIEEATSETEARASLEARARDEKGRFAPSATDADAEQPKPAEEAEADPAPAKPALDAPAGFSEAGKAAWAQTPDHVKADVARRFSEMEQGIKTYQADYGDLKEYASIAKQQGTTLKAAMDRYVGMEKMLASDPAQGIKKIADNLGIDLGALIGQPAPPEVAKVQQEAAHWRQQAEAAQRQLASMQQQTIAQQIESAKANMPRFEELEPVMARLITSGVAEGLDDAYRMADRLAPAAEPVVPPAPQTRTPPTSRSVAGAPPTGSNPAARKPAPSAREALLRAFS